MEKDNVYSNLEGTIDLYLVMDEMGMMKDCLDRRLPKSLKFNQIKFTPKSSHKCRFEGRKRDQKIEGDFDSSRYALITDVSWWKGNSLREILGYLDDQGYEKEKIYAFYFWGGHPEISFKDKMQESPLEGKAYEVLNFIENINKELSYNARHKKSKKI